MTQIADCQPELNLRLRKAQTTVCEDSINELLGLLRGRGWVTRRELCALRPEWSERFVRALAAASGERVISAPGGRGYHAREAITVPQMQRACDAIQSQMRKMGRKLIAYRRILKGLQLATPSGEMEGSAR